MMLVDVDVALEVASHEAIIRQAYKDSAGIWTWSVGLTSATGHSVNRYINNPQPMQKCLEIFAWALDNYAKQVRDEFAGYNLTKAQFAAALSFHWNTGAIHKATWVTEFKAGRMAQAEAQFKYWNKSAGQTVAGLTKRRAKEADLLFRGKWSNNGTMTEYTRLKADHTPDWTSAKRVDVAGALRAAMGSPGVPIPPPQIDQTPRPYNTPTAPTMTPYAGLIMVIVMAVIGGFVFLRKKLWGKKDAD